MKQDHLGLCGKCYARVPAEFVKRDGKLWLRKLCPECGPNEALVSSDAEVWQAKRDLWDYVPLEDVPCTLNCEGCRIDHHPNLVFLDVTNRCNMNCPICIATIRGMGFDFHPPLSYFEKIFDELGSWEPKPMLQLFGGEPTLREDLLEIIAMARRRGLKPKVVTNGLKLADEEYCKQLCEARVSTRFSFDGRSADIYEKMRDRRSAYPKKVKALENLKKHSPTKHAIVAAAAYGINDDYIGDLIQYVHDNRDLILDLGIIPLTENWEEGEFDAATQTTMEDVEKMVKAAVPGGEVEFVPAGMTYALKKSRAFFRGDKPSDILLLSGVHPNCESITILVSDGETYRSINHYLRKPLGEVVVELAKLAGTLDPKLDRLDRSRFWPRLWGRALVVKTFAPWALRTIRFGRLAEGNPAAALLKLLFGRKDSNLPKGRRPRRLLRVAILPFEEQNSVDAARMMSCKAVFAYEDAEDGKVKTIPACMWYPYRNPILKRISEKYGTTRKPAEEVAVASAKSEVGSGA